MRRSFLAFIAVLIGLACVTNTLGQKTPPRAPNTAESKTAPGPHVKPSVERKRLTGVVITIDITSKTLVVKNWRGETTFDVASAKIAPLVNLKDVKPGDRVRINYAEEDGHKIAKVLIVTSAKPEERNKTGAPKETKPLTEEPLKNVH